MKFKTAYIFLFFITIFSVNLGYAQFDLPLNNYNGISSSFAEIRSHKFHYGLDFRTHQKTGVPIIAAADGYVYRVVTGYTGYGKAIYLRHKNSKFTVYGHLSSFADTLEKFVFEKQSKSKIYTQDIMIGPDKFIFSKGDTIGYSGNTGSSSGPHLHFEIRDLDEKIEDPMQYFSNLIPDKISPTLEKIALEPIESKSRVNGDYEKVIFTPYKIGKNHYKISDTIKIKGRFGVQFKAYDKLDYNSFKQGIAHYELFVDDKADFQFDLKKFSFDESKFSDLCFDYEYFVNSGSKKEQYFNCFKKKGNQLQALSQTFSDGLIELNDTKSHKMSLNIYDHARNKVTCDFWVKQDTSSKEKWKPSAKKYATYYQSFVKNGNLVIRLKHPTTKDLEEGKMIYANGDTVSIKPNLLIYSRALFILPLDANNYPVKFISPYNKTLEFNFKGEVLPNNTSQLKFDSLNIEFPYGCVAENYHVEIQKGKQVNGTIAETFTIGNENTIIMNPIKLTYNFSKLIDDKTVFVKIDDKGKLKYVDGSYAYGHKCTGNITSFGTYGLAIDNKAPTITPITFKEDGTIWGNHKKVKLKITDNLAGVLSSSIQVFFDNEWLPFDFNTGNGYLEYTFADYIEKGEHAVLIKCVDNANNYLEKSYKFTIK